MEQRIKESGWWLETVDVIMLLPLYVVDKVTKSDRVVRREVCSVLSKGENLCWVKASANMDPYYRDTNFEFF